MRRVCLAYLTLATAVYAADPKKTGPTHETTTTIAVKGEKSALKLQTLCLDGDDRVIALVAPDRYGAVNGSRPTSCEVHIYTASGEKQRSWDVPFVGQSINVGPDGSIYVAGEGRIAKFDKAGKKLANVELPHVGKSLADKDALLELAKETIEENVKAYGENVKQFNEQIDALVKKLDASDLTATEKQQLAQYRATVKAYERIVEQEKVRKPEDVVKQVADRVRVINGVVATSKDIFVVSGGLKGYGYTVWRMDHTFANPKAILTDLGGCCGQMDVQASGNELFVAENTKHRVGHYNRDGKKLGSFGKSGRDGGDPECFGGCCNPMNVRIGSAGVYTAESEGIIKLFSPSGEFLGTVGSLKIKEGCKNVAIAVSSDGAKVYFCDVPASKIHVLAKKPANTAAE
ncbi:MAG: hypothetical protein U0746_22295 [Gemmataceae bacterium]